MTSRPFVLLSDSNTIGSRDMYRQVTTEISIRSLDVMADYDVFLLFMKQYSFSQDTFNSYRRDVERFLLWLWLVHKSQISQTTADIVTSYIQFFKKPPHAWQQSSRQVRLSKDGQINPSWRPFMASSKQVSAHTLKSMLAILRTFFQFCLEEGVIHRNPVAALKQKRQHLSSSQEQTVLRRMNQQQWETVIGVALNNQHKNIESARALFVLSLFYLLGVRISEVSSTERHTPTMGDFYLDADQHWWFRALGKGNKQRDIAVADELLEVLKSYRSALGLCPLPVMNEATPLIKKLKGDGGCGIRQMRNILQVTFNNAVLDLRSQGFVDLATHLEQATAHWLRHTAISDDVTNRPLEHVRDDAGHSNIRITSHYITTDRTMRYLSAKDKKLIK